MEVIIAGGIAVWFAFAMRSIFKSGGCSGCAGCAYRGQCDKEKK